GRSPGAPLGGPPAALTALGHAPRRAPAGRPSRRELVARDEAALREERLEAQEPLLVVARGQVPGGRDPLARVARHVDVPLAQEARGHRERERAALPLVVEDGLVLLALDRPHPVHAAHVVDAVHRGPPRAGGVTLAT